MNGKCYPLIIVALVALLGTHILLQRAVYAASSELFSPLTTNQLNDMSPVQKQRADQIKHRSTTLSLTLLRVDVNALKEDSTRISLPGAKTLDFSKSNIEIRSTNDFTWFGTLSTIPGKATFVVRNGNTTGTIRDGSDLYRVEPVGNGVHALIKVDESRFPPEEPPSFREIEKRSDLRQSPASEFDSQRGDFPVVIDVLVAYTAAARKAVSDITATIQLAIDEANQSYRNSDINIKLAKVSSFEVSYVESGKTFDKILDDFKGMIDVNNRRNDSGADMSVLIIDQSDYCGKAAAIQADASTAFAIVYYDCATGRYSFAHELGHLQGARHDPDNDSTSNPFSYGHGFQHASPSPSWRTIMAYDCPQGCPRLQYWSNPNIKYNNIAMGTTDTSDNARVLNETARAVSRFKSRPVHSKIPVSCTVFGDGYSNQSAPSDAIYFAGNAAACTPDGTASGNCHKWFGRCATVGSNPQSVNFRVFNDGDSNQTASFDAVYNNAPNVSCIPDGTPKGNCRRWFGLAETNAGRKVKCYLFDDGYTNMVGPTNAIYYRAPGSVCMPDGSATGKCRKWFGRCEVQIPPRPPQPRVCSSSEQCCDPTDDGTKCFLCWPRNRLCP